MKKKYLNILILALSCGALLISSRTYCLIGTELWPGQNQMEEEAVAAGVGGACATYDGRLVYHLDGTGAPGPEVSWASGDALYDGYAVKDDNGNLVTLRQYDAAKGITHAKGSGSSGGSSSAPACEHEYTSEVTKQPTCVDPGETTYTCSKCGHSYTEEIPATGEHDFEITTTKEPTCTEKGLALKTCKVCGLEEEVELPAVGHDYESTVTKEATCIEPGIETFTCKNCGDTYEEEIPALGHKESEWVTTKEPGWFTPGMKEITCLTCGEVLHREEIPQKYPTWYLFTGIGAVVVIIALAVFLITKNRKKKL